MSPRTSLRRSRYPGTPRFVMRVYDILYQLRLEELPLVRLPRRHTREDRRARPPPAEDPDHPLPECGGEVLAIDIAADRNIPPFPRAAMDGFAVVWTGKEDQVPYRVIGTVIPGFAGAGTRGRGLHQDHDRGRRAPPFDTVIQVEQSQAAWTGRSGSPRRPGPAEHRPGGGRRPQGGGAHPGRDRPVLPPRRHPAPPSGNGRFPSSTDLRDILPTGSELMNRGSRRKAMIRNSNAHFVRAALSRLGARESTTGGS